MSEQMTLGERIKDARMGLELTVAQAARQAGITEKTLRSWESGKSEPRGSRLSLLAGVLNVSLVWLMEGRSDLDPIVQEQSSLDVIQQKLEQMRTLQDDLARICADLEAEVANLKERDARLEKLAREEFAEN